MSYPANTASGVSASTATAASRRSAFVTNRGEHITGAPPLGRGLQGVGRPPPSPQRGETGRGTKGSIRPPLIYYSDSINNGMANLRSATMPSFPRGQLDDAHPEDERVRRLGLLGGPDA